MFVPLVFTCGIRASVRLLADTTRCPQHGRQWVVESEDMSSQVTFPIPVVKSIPMEKRNMKKRNVPATKCFVALSTRH